MLGHLTRLGWGGCISPFYLCKRVLDLFIYAFTRGLTSKGPDQKKCLGIISTKFQMDIYIRVVLPGY